MKLPGKTISIKQSDSPPRNNAKSQSQIIPSPVLHKAEHDCTFKIKFTLTASVIALSGINRNYTHELKGGHTLQRALKYR